MKQTAEPVEKISWLIPFSDQKTLQEFVKTFSDKITRRLEQYHHLSDEDKAAAAEELLSCIWLYGEETRQAGALCLSPVEAIYGFVWFLSGRLVATTFGAKEPSRNALPLITRFVKAQGWSPKVREGWADNLKPVPQTVADVPKRD